MEYKEAEQWLESYRELYEDLIFIENARLGRGAISYTEKSGARKSEVEYLQEIEAIKNNMILIENTISQIPDHYARLVLQYQYLLFRSYEQIGEIIGYSVKQVSRYHKKGIEYIKDVR